MKKLTALLCGLLLAALSSTVTAAPGDFKINKVTVSLVPTPIIQFTGEQRESPSRTAQWLEIEVQFQAAPLTTDEATFKYFVQINNAVIGGQLVGSALLVGEVVHVNVEKGQGLHSVMYIAPRTLARMFPGQPIIVGLITNAAAQIYVKGVPEAEGYAKGNPNGTWAALPQTPGLLLNKSETPFAPLYWDRYEAIKPK